MVRATAAEIKKLFLGSWPPGASDTNVGEILAGVDYKLDGYVKKHYEVSLSTTDTDVVHIANLLGTRVILRAIWGLAGGELSERPEPALFTEEIKMLIEAVISDTSKDGTGWIPMQGSSST